MSCFIVDTICQQPILSFYGRAEQICDIQYGKQAGERNQDEERGKEDAEDELYADSPTMLKKNRFGNAGKKWPAKKRKSISKRLPVQESEKQTSTPKH